MKSQSAIIAEDADFVTLFTERVRRGDLFREIAEEFPDKFVGPGRADIRAKRLAEYLGIYEPRPRRKPYAPESEDPRKAAVPPVVAETHTHTGDKWDIHLPKTRINTLEELLAHCKVDTDVWEVEKYTVNKWEVGAKDADGEVQVTPLFQVKASLKRRTAIADAKEILSSLILAAKRHSPVYAPLSRASRASDGHLLTVNIPDAHFGKLAWGSECWNGESYDLKITTRLFLEAVDDILAKSRGYDVSRIVFPVGNDLMHIDSQLNATTKGTVQDVDGRYKKTFSTVKATLIRAIDTLRERAPVQVVFVAGNHDEHSCFTLGEVIDAWYHNCAEVEVDNRPVLKKYLEYGACMIGYAHGDKEKPASLAYHMAVDEPAMWARTLFREMHIGHRHAEKSDEFSGVKVRMISSLCAADRYHADHGFVGNIRGAAGLIYDAADGHVGSVFYNVLRARKED